MTEVDWGGGASCFARERPLRDKRSGGTGQVERLQGSASRAKGSECEKSSVHQRAAVLLEVRIVVVGGRGRAKGRDGENGTR